MSGPARGDHEDLAFRHPELADGRRVFELVRAAGTLEPNSPYAYALLCSDFRRSCLVAERGGELVGAVVGYRPPERPEVLFVWQIAVSARVRGRGVGGAMLDALVARAADATHLEATVAPSNAASRALFTAFARRAGAPVEIGEGFLPHHFPGAEHEPEARFRIGPLRRDR